MIKLLNTFSRLFKHQKYSSIDPLLTCNVQQTFTLWSKLLPVEIPPTQPPTSIDAIVGNYAVDGGNSDGSRYFGTLRLSTSGNLVKGYWEIGHSRQPQHGVGFLENDLLALDFYYVDEGKRYYGQVIYRVAGDTLTGLWREYQNPKLAQEIATLKNRL